MDRPATLRQESPGYSLGIAVQSYPCPLAEFCKSDLPPARGDAHDPASLWFANSYTRDTG